MAGLVLAGCQDMGTKETIGTGIGAAAGGLAGSQFGHGKGGLAMTALGAVLGGVVGSSVGKSLDRQDQMMMSQTTQRTLETMPSGRTSTWRNPDSGASGTVVPQPAYTAGNGQTCREFQQTVTIGGQSQQAYGTACRQSDGSWRVVSN